jgi:demethylmenaquinone methyltransferase/2-methoxy-6-polyprenyl-1,4-benzoquinol methylase
MISLGYGLRHVGDLRMLFDECRRVLKPGGRLLVLELTQPRSPWARRLNRFYLGKVVPQIAYLTSGREATRRMMQYFWETIENCVPPDVILQALGESGFEDAHRKVSGGVLSEFIAVKKR